MSTAYLCEVQDMKSWFNYALAIHSEAKEHRGLDPWLYAELYMWDKQSDPTNHKATVTVYNNAEQGGHEATMNVDLSQLTFCVVPRERPANHQRPDHPGTGKRMRLVAGVPSRH